MIGWKLLFRWDAPYLSPRVNLCMLNNINKRPRQYRGLFCYLLHRIVNDPRIISNMIKYQAVLHIIILQRSTMCANNTTIKQVSGSISRKECIIYLQTTGTIKEQAIPNMHCRIIHYVDIEGGIV